MESLARGTIKIHLGSRNESTKNYSKMARCAGLLISIYPILAPYKVLGISLNLLLGLLFVMYHFINRKSLPVISYTKPIIVYTLLSVFLSINAAFVLLNISNLVNSALAMVLDLIIYVVLWYYADINATMKVANTVAYICCGYALLQMLFLISGKVVPLGQIPFFELSTGWVEGVWGFRFNSVFSEPSYFAIYLLPVFLYNFINKSWFKAIVFASFIVLSSSTLGIIVLGMLLVLGFFSVGFDLKKRLQVLFVLLIFFIFAGIFLSEIPVVAKFIALSFEKIEDLVDDLSNNGFQENIRLFGYLDLFDDLPIKEQIFGVGVSQLQNYFAEQGVYITNYSNSFVLSLLNSGVIGFVIFLLFLCRLLNVSFKEKTFLFFLILIAVFATDSALFSYRYYWLVYFVLFSNKRVESVS